MTDDQFAELDRPRACVQRAGSREWGPMAWEAWVAHGLTRYASEHGTYAWTQAGAERKARRLLRRYLASRRGPIVALSTTTTEGTQMAENELLGRLLRGRGLRSRLSSRRCPGCDDMSFHTAHLTWFGRRRLR